LFYGGIWCDIIIFVLFGDGDCGGGYGYFHGKAWQSGQEGNVG